MILGHHVIFGAYGSWLPNDPRGSWSEFVGSWELFRFGAATTTSLKSSQASVPHDAALRRMAKSVLTRPETTFSGTQAQAIGVGFQKYATKAKLPVWACAILPQHVHLVLGPHSISVESVVNQLKGTATRELLNRNIHPFQHLTTEGNRPPTCWARGHWKVFLGSQEALVNEIRYVEGNPVKEDLPIQNWSFVTEYQVDSV